MERKVGNIDRRNDQGMHLKERVSQVIEVRPAELERDAEAIADIFNNPRVIEHMAGVAPRQSPRNIKLFRAHIQDHIHLSPGATMTQEGLEKFAKNIIIATPVEIRAFFAKFSDVETYVAMIGEKVVGTASFEGSSPTQSGKRVGTIFKVAVDPDAPKAIESSQYGKGIARSLIRVINNRARELSLTGIVASIIKGVEGYQSPMTLFLNEGYVMGPESPGDTLGWDYKIEKFVERGTLKLQLQLATPQTSQ